MPIHDWSRVDVDVYHHFHQFWTMAICDALNAGLLPRGYSALVERQAMSLIPNLLAPDRRPRSRRQDEPADGLLTVPPATRHVMQTSELFANIGNRIAVRHRLGEVVCILELVSPGNKSSRHALRSFVNKSVEFLRRGVHLLVIDLFPPSVRDPQGIHQAIWNEFDEDASFELPPDKPLTLAAYVAGDLAACVETTAYIELVAPGDVLPDMPAYLEPGGYVPVRLEATYQAAWANCPGVMRELVETGRLEGEGEATV